MPFTLVGWSESQDASAALTKFKALEDPHVRVEADNIIVPNLTKLAGAYAVGTGLVDAQLDSPSLRRMLLFDINPVDTGAEPAADIGTLLTDLFASPYSLEKAEPLSALAQNTAVNWATILAWLSDGPVKPITGNIVTIKATAAVTLTPYAWTNGSLTFTQTLPAGRYAIVGARAISTGLIAFRFVLPGYPWRPGAIGCDADNDIVHPIFRHGKLGSWGQFEHNVPPTVDFLSVSADTSEEVWLDLIKVR